MNEVEFADFHPRYSAECIRRGVKLYAPEVAAAMLTELGIVEPVTLRAQRHGEAGKMPRQSLQSQRRKVSATRDAPQVSSYSITDLSTRFPTSTQCGSRGEFPKVFPAFPPCCGDVQRHTSPSLRSSPFHTRTGNLLQPWSRPVRNAGLASWALLPRRRLGFEARCA